MKPPKRLLAASLIVGATLVLSWRGLVPGEAALAVVISVGAALGVYRNWKQ